MLNPVVILDRVIAEYRDYLRSEFRASDPGLREALERELDGPLFLAQEPFFQAHRPFRTGAPWRELALDPQIAAAMAARARRQGATEPERAYLHQSESIAHLLGAARGPLVVTTGTGSGKTECFLLPVIQNAIEDATRFRRDGITAVLVYPMNALANDQVGRIESLLDESRLAGVIRVEKYDRGTGPAKREELRRRPPHVLLTNYMMLEYLLTRPRDREDLFANHRCRFLVLDEVHTYRGTLGVHVGLLVRRLATHLARARQDWDTEIAGADRERRFPALVPVGTSATIKSAGDETGDPGAVAARRDAAVREFFARVSGAAEPAIRVIGEALAEVAPPTGASYPPEPAAVGAFDAANPAAVARVVAALAGVSAETSVRDAARRARILWDLAVLLVRRPMSVGQIAERIRRDVPARREASLDAVRREVEAALAAGAALPDDVPGALRLRAHRMLRGGWRFHRCVDPACGRLFPKGEERCTCGRVAAPLLLCRSCGADYLSLAGAKEDPAALHAGRPSVEGGEAEWLVFDEARAARRAATEEQEEDEDAGAGEGERESEDEADRGGEVESRGPRSARSRGGRRGLGRVNEVRGRKVLSGSLDPVTLLFSPDARAYARVIQLAPERSRCIACGGTAGNRAVITPVSLGTSAAVKVMGEGLVEALADAHATERDRADRKERLLIFSDSRQDAAHQARFLTFAGRYDRMRRAAVEILRREGTPLSIGRLVQLLGNRAGETRDGNPHVPDRTWIPDEARRRIEAWEEAPLLDDIALSAGYRGTLLNLGLVGVDAHGLPAFLGERGLDVARRLGVDTAGLELIVRAILDEVRRRGALDREALRYHRASPQCPEAVRAAGWERRIQWAQGYAADERGRPVAYLPAEAVPAGIQRHNVWRRDGRGRAPSIEAIVERLHGLREGAKPTAADALALLELLCEGSYLTATKLFGARTSRELLQAGAEQVRLVLLSRSERRRCAVCRTPQPFRPAGAPCYRYRCEGRLVVWEDEEVEASRYVRRLREGRAAVLHAAEHTAQVPGAVREEREADFKAPAAERPLNVLACSPTLEMGIDVGGLDAVILRNVPPRPDNYAQRGGRAGRRSRVGLVLGYARSTPHDQYFFDRPEEMIAGEVPAPLVPLGNRDVILRHVAAIAFGLAEPGLAGRMVEYVTTQGELEAERIEELCTALRSRAVEALTIAREAFGQALLAGAGLDEGALAAHLDCVVARTRAVFEHTARQVQELRRPLESFAERLENRYAGTRSAEMVARLLGLPPERGRGAPAGGAAAAAEADDRSAGYPLRRFAEFGILPGYEFPSEPAAVRLLGDDHEEEPVTVGRRFGIAQFQPDANVYARGARWKVIGLDPASPWNQRGEAPAWRYRLCSSCGLRFDDGQPRCPRCGAAEVGPDLPAYEFAGFVARRDEAPVLDEEERFAVRNLVRAEPQWNGEVAGRWTTADGWPLRLSRREEVRWLNEGWPPPPAARNADNAAPVLHVAAKGWLLCGACGRMLHPAPPEDGRRGRRRATTTGTDDRFGHGSRCPRAGTPPVAIALVTATQSTVLRLIVPVPSAAPVEDVRSWGLSLGYALRTGLRRQFMLEGAEMEFELEGPYEIRDGDARGRRVALSFIDPSLGGSGFLERMADGLGLVAMRALEHLSHADCSSACYRCLKSYQNQRYHDLLHWPQVVDGLEGLAQAPPAPAAAEPGDDGRAAAWLEAYAAGVGSPLELRFWRLFEANGFTPQKQVPIVLSPGAPAASVADFAVPESRLAIYVDGASFHVGGRLRRDRAIRERLRAETPPWDVVELRAADLQRGAALVEDLKARLNPA